MRTIFNDLNIDGGINDWGITIYIKLKNMLNYIDSIQQTTLLSWLGINQLGLKFTLALS